MIYTGFHVRNEKNIVIGKWQPDAVVLHSLKNVLLLNQWTWIWSQPLDLKTGDKRQSTLRDYSLKHLGLEKYFSKVIWDLLWINEKLKEKEASECHCRNRIWILKGGHKRKLDVFIATRHLYERNVNCKTILYYKTKQIQKSTHNRQILQWVSVKWAP